MKASTLSKIIATQQNNFKEIIGIWKIILSDYI